MARREKLEFVAQDAIYAENVKKEQRLQKLHTEFHINPFRKLHVLPDKPMSRKHAEEIDENYDFIKEFHRAYMEPNKKYPVPQTESQELGWDPVPLIPTSRTDRRFNFPRVGTDVTRHAEYARLTMKHVK